MEKDGRPGQATDDSIIRRMRFAYWITWVQTHTQNMHYLLLFHGNNCYANVPQFYVTRTSPVLLISMGLPTVGSMVAIYERERTGHYVV